MGSIFLECENEIPLIERLAEIAERLAEKPDIHPSLQNDLLRLAGESRQKIKANCVVVLERVSEDLLGFDFSGLENITIKELEEMNKRVMLQEELKLYSRGLQ